MEKHARVATDDSIQLFDCLMQANRSQLKRLIGEMIDLSSACVVKRVLESAVSNGF